MLRLVGRPANLLRAVYWGGATIHKTKRNNHEAMCLLATKKARKNFPQRTQRPHQRRCHGTHALYPPNSCTARISIIVLSISPFSICFALCRGCITFFSAKSAFCTCRKQLLFAKRIPFSCKTQVDGRLCCSSTFLLFWCFRGKMRSQELFLRVNLWFTCCLLLACNMGTRTSRLGVPLADSALVLWWC